VNYRDGDFVEACKQATGGRGVDLVLDHIGAAYLEKNLASLGTGGRLVMIGLMGGAKAEINLALLLARRLQLIGSTLRARPVEEKAGIVDGFLERFGAALTKGELRATVDRVLPLSQAADAHRAMKASEHFGKIILRVGE
jgi:NADPH:quinone reductase-like Zn-dependent oxidoreductase